MTLTADQSFVLECLAPGHPGFCTRISVPQDRRDHAYYEDTWDGDGEDLPGGRRVVATLVKRGWLIPVRTVERRGWRGENVVTRTETDYGLTFRGLLRWRRWRRSEVAP